jgi:hypothetical protein
MRIGAIAGLALLGGGCVPTSFYTQSVPLDVQADQFNTTAARTERLMIVRNVMRARDRTSMVFTRLTGFTGSMQRTVSASASATAHEGGDGAIVSPGVSVGGQASPSFNLAILNDQRFHRAIETSIDLSLYQSLIESGWRPNLLHSLFIERVEFDGRAYNNDPSDEDSFNAFQAWLHSQPAPLQICSESKPQAFSPPLAASSSDMGGAAAIAAQQLELQAQADGSYQVIRARQNRWFAFACERAANTPQPRVTVRSIEGVLFYLGEIVRAEQRHDNAHPLMVTIRFNDDPEALFVVHRASEGHPSGIVFQHEDGESYYIPYPNTTRSDGPRDRTHQVITLLLQLIGVLQERSDVPATQTVRVIP